MQISIVFILNISSILNSFSIPDKIVIWEIQLNPSILYLISPNINFFNLILPPSFL